MELAVDPGALCVMRYVLCSTVVAPTPRLRHSQSMPEDSDFVYRVLTRRPLASADASTLQLHFALAVLDRYRDASGYSLIRSNSVGRLRKEGDWSIDFGISPDEALLHASFQD